MDGTLDIIVMVGQLILALSILVGVHEGGHLLAAKLFGMRVEQFSIGFPPKIFGFKYRNCLFYWRDTFGWFCENIWDD